MDVISYQQTSRRLRDSAESRSVWAALTAEYCVRHLNHPHPPTGSFKTKELRQWVTERCIIDETWKQPVPHPRRINLTCGGRPSTATIVPGGRWALLGDWQGFVYAYDLHDEDPQPSPLVAPQKSVAGTNQSVEKIVVSVDSESPTLGFMVAFTGEELYPPAWLHTWQVQLISNDALRAHRVLSIPCSKYFPTISMSDHLVARTFIPLLVPDSWAEVFRWKECSETRIVKSTIHMQCQPEFTQIIGNDRLFCADHRKGFYIYNIPDPDTFQSEQMQEPFYHQSAPLSSPTWFYPLPEGPGGHLGYSGLYFDQLHYRQVISTHDGIIGLIIPVSREELPYVLNLVVLPFKAPPACGLGLYKGYAALEGEGARFGYSWHEGLLDAPVYHNGHGKKLIPLGLSSYMAFDEETGRFIGIPLDHAMLIDFMPDGMRNIRRVTNRV